MGNCFKSESQKRQQQASKKVSQTLETLKEMIKKKGTKLTDIRKRLDSIIPNIQHAKKKGQMTDSLIDRNHKKHIYLQTEYQKNAQQINLYRTQLEQLEKCQRLLKLKDEPTIKQSKSLCKQIAKQFKVSNQSLDQQQINKKIAQIQTYNSSLMQFKSFCQNPQKINFDYCIDPKTLKNPKPKLVKSHIFLNPNQESQNNPIQESQIYLIQQKIQD